MSGTGKHAAAVVVLSERGEPSLSTKETRGDGTVSESFAPPGPRAFVRIASWEQGFAYRCPTVASGDI